MKSERVAMFQETGLALSQLLPIRPRATPTTSLANLYLQLKLLVYCRFGTVFSSVGLVANENQS